jgi:hypothetical protein
VEKEVGIVLIISIWSISIFLAFVPLSLISTLLVVFWLTGYVLRSGPVKLLDIIPEFPNAIFSFIFDIGLSFLAIIPIAVILSINYQLTTTLVWLIYSILIVICRIVTHRLYRKEKESIIQFQEKVEIPTRHSISMMVLLLIWGVVIASYRFIKFSYPFLTGTDSFSHLAAIKTILYNHGTNNIIGSYPYVYHSIVALISGTSGFDPHILLNILPVIFYPASLLLSFFVVLLITKQSTISFLGAAGTFAIYEHGGLLATYYPFPSTFLFLCLYSVLLIALATPINKKGYATVIFSFGLCYLLYGANVLTLIPLLLFLFAGRFSGTDYVAILGDICFAFITIGGALLTAAYYWLLPLLGIDYPFFNVTSLSIGNYLDVATIQFTLSYSILQTIALVFGIIVSFAFGISERLAAKLGLNNAMWMSFFRVTATYLVVFFSPLLYAYRTELYVRPFFSTAIVVFIFFILRGAVVFFKERKINLRVDPRYSKEQFFVVVCIVLLLTSGEKLNSQIGFIRYGEPLNPDVDEAELFFWLENHTEVGDYILTDISSGYFMRGVIFRNASTSFILDEKSKSPYIHEELSNRIFDFLNSTEDNVNETYHALLEDQTLMQYTSEIDYILITPRTNSWIYRAREGRFSRNTPYRYEMLTSDPSWSKFYSDYFTLIASVGEAMILQFNQTP